MSQLGDGNQRGPGGRRAARALNFIVSNNNNALFSAQPAVARTAR